MCVKQFYGYNCGHCSIPTLVACPLVASNPFFPPCGFPAERPIFTGQYCHACFRVVWNAKVLKDEEEHRVCHLRGECTCEVRFEREDHLNNITRGHATNAQLRPIDGHVPVPAHATVQGNGAAHFSATGDINCAAAQRHWQTHDFLPNSNNQFEFQRQDVHMIDATQSYTIAVSTHDTERQLMIGEVGSGMKWYTSQPTMSSQLSRPHHKAHMGEKLTSARPAKNCAVALSEPGPSGQVISAARDEGRAELQQPTVVSSDLAELALE